MPDREYRTLKLNLDQSWFDEVDGGRVLRNVVQVRAARTRRVTIFSHDDMALVPGDHVVFETDRGTSHGEVVSEPERRWVGRKGLKAIVRMMGGALSRWQKDRAAERQKAARLTCQDLAMQYRLDMKLVDVEYVHWENRTVFYFVADGRVDFRELVKELSRKLRCRIEMRQIGPRDETKMLGGLGRCGREHCCSTHLTEFKSVRTKMAKEQGLVVNQEKITGHCRKLLCCLSYEREVYAELRRNLPHMGTRVKTAEGTTRIVEAHILKQTVKLLPLAGGSTTEVHISRLIPRDVPDGEDGPDAITFDLKPEVRVEKRDPLEFMQTSSPASKDKEGGSRDSGRRGRRGSGRSRGRKGGGGEQRKPGEKKKEAEGTARGSRGGEVKKEGSEGRRRRRSRKPREKREGGEAGTGQRSSEKRGGGKEQPARPGGGGGGGEGQKEGGTGRRRRRRR